MQTATSWGYREGLAAKNTSLERTQVLFLAPMSGNSELPVTSAPRDLTPSSGLLGCQHTCTCTHIHKEKYVRQEGNTSCSRPDQGPSPSQQHTACTLQSSRDIRSCHEEEAWHRRTMPRFQPTQRPSYQAECLPHSVYAERSLVLAF